MTTSNVDLWRMELAPAAALFLSLGDPARLAIVCRLATGAARVVDLTDEVGLARATVSAHLACLRDCGLVASRPVGRASVFSLTRPELAELLGAGEAVLTATGSAVAPYPECGTGQAPAARSTKPREGSWPGA